MMTNDDTVAAVIGQPIFNGVRNQLIDHGSRIDRKLPQEFWQVLSNIKDDFVVQGNQLGAKAAWCLEIIGHCQDNFISAFLSINAGEFREAWDLLSNCEDAVLVVG